MQPRLRRKLREPEPRSTKSLIDKLGVKSDSKVAVIGVNDENFWRQLKKRAIDISVGRLRKDCDFVFFLAESKEVLGKVKSLQDYIKRNGAIWVVTPKGRQHIKENDVIASGKDAGLVDVKVVSFSDTHTALKLVIPLARR